MDEDQLVHLYGTPGQQRFDFMWKILVKGGIGLVLLVDNTRPDPIADMEFYLDAFADFIEETGVVIGVTRSDLSSQASLDDYLSRLVEREQIFPVFEIDGRSRDDVATLIHALLAYLQVEA